MSPIVVAMGSDTKLRRRNWLEHFYGDDALPLRRVFRLGFRDAIVETTLRLKSRPGFRYLLKRWLQSGEWERWRRHYEARCVRRNNELYRVPADLALTDLPVRRALVVGSCLSKHLIGTFESVPGGCPCDFVLLTNIGELPANPPRPVAEYDFQLVQLVLRSLVPDAAFFYLPHADPDAHERFFEDIRQRLPHELAAVMRWNVAHGLLTFVSNFLVPQQNPMGRLLPRYDLRNPVHLVERINVLLAEELKRYKNAYLLDADQIASTFGKAFIQDDSIEMIGHNSVLDETLDAADRHRIEWLPPLTDLYNVHITGFARAIWAEMVAMRRTVRQLDQVKLVAVDLDDTLWRGIAAEGEGGDDPIEGWPLGIIEALHFLKKRGVLLAIVSKNDEARIAQLWDQIMRGRMSLDDFAVRRINWRPKAENLEDILREVNILPRSVVFIDDNPVERAGVKAALPDVRVLGAHPYLIRRILLWAPETQVSVVTDESARRTEMVRAQVEREADRKQMSRGDFLASLNVKVKLVDIGSADDKRFPRALELINKTNQFNTTGRRWALADCVAAFAHGGVFHAFEVQDRFTHYGLVGVVVTQAGRIEQFVMSCRVLGLDVEKAIVAELSRRLQSGGDFVALLEETEANFPCRDLYARCGFTAAGGRWIKAHDSVVEAPKHVALI
jgi:FkbH-like protein